MRVSEMPYFLQPSNDFDLVIAFIILDLKDRLT